MHYTYEGKISKQVYDTAIVYSFIATSGLTYHLKELTLYIMSIMQKLLNLWK